MPPYTHTMIFLHGFTMEPKDMEYFTDKIDRILPKGVKMKYIFPKAPEREISCYDGESYSAWYDYLTENNGLSNSQYFINWFNNVPYTVIPCFKLSLVEVKNKVKKILTQVE